MPVAAWLVAMAVVVAQPAEERQLLDVFAALERERSEALRINDVAAVERIYATDFIGITADGSSLTRESMLEGLSGRPAQSTRFVAEELAVKLVDGVALVSGRIVGRDPSGSVVRNGRFLHVYQRHRDRWRIVAATATPIAPK